jgi:subtilisin family serine protease
MGTMNFRLGHLLLLALALAAAACGGGGAPANQAAPPEPAPAPEAPPPPDGTPYGTADGHVLAKPAADLLVPFPLVLASLGSAELGPVEGTSYVRARVPQGETPAGFVARLESDARVAAAELDLGLAGPEGNGRTIPAGGTLLSVSLASQPDLVRIGIDAAQARSRGAGVLVAVLDSGVVAGHAFLDGRLAEGGRDFVRDDADPAEERNALDDDEDGAIDEGWGHGTFVASLVLAVAPDARVLPVRVLGSDLFGTSSGVAAAIVYAARQGCDVIHVSVSAPPEVRVVREAVENARLLGAVVIASAGNSGAEDVGAEQGASGVFLVTALDPDDLRAEFASFGAGVALAAPGVDVHGAFPSVDPDTAVWSGTSFSAPLVSGAFALLRELDVLSSPDVLLERLRRTAMPVDALNPGLEGKLGAGRLDLDAATAP